MRNAEYKPLEGDHLHPRTGQRNQLSGEEEPEIAIAERHQRANTSALSTRTLSAVVISLVDRQPSSLQNFAWDVVRLPILPPATSNRTQQFCTAHRPNDGV